MLHESLMNVRFRDVKYAVNKIEKASDFVYRGTTRVFLRYWSTRQHRRVYYFYHLQGQFWLTTFQSYEICEPCRFGRKAHSFCDWIAQKKKKKKKTKKKKKKQRDWLALTFFWLKYFRFFSISELGKT